MFRRVGHRWQFPAQCAWYCPPAYLQSPSSLSRISAVVIIRCRPHHITSIFLSPSSRLFSTFLLPRVSATVSAAILIHFPCHLAYLHTLSSSTCSSPDVIIHHRLHNTASLPPPALLSLPHILWYHHPATLPLPCSLPEPRYVLTSRSSCTTQPMLSGAAFWSVGRLHSNQGYVLAVPVGRQPAIFLGRQISGLEAWDTCNHVCSGSGMPHFISQGNCVSSTRTSRM